MKKAFVLTFILLLLTVAASCESENATGQSKVYYEYFDTVTEITAYGVDSDEFEQNCEAVRLLLEEYHRLLDIYHEYSNTNNLCTVNKKGAQAPVTVDQKLIDVLNYGKEIYDITKGQCNVAFGAVTSLWHEAREKGDTLPDGELLKQASLHCNIDDIIIDEQNKTVFLNDPYLSVDVGALGKGYACEMAAQLLISRGAEGYAVNIGGNIRVTGQKTQKECWSAGIQNPDLNSETPYIATVELEIPSLVTSGSYMRYYTVNGEKYHHIIDPETLYPKNTFTSVSVLCESSALGDALSTALFNMSLEEGAALVDSLENVHALWVCADGTTHYSDGFSGYLKK